MKYTILTLTTLAILIIVMIISFIKLKSPFLKVNEITQTPFPNVNKITQTPFPNVNEITQPVECQLNWGNWSSCDENGKQKRTANILVKPNLTNTCSPTLQHRDCSCEIVYTDNNWSECIEGTQINLGEKRYSEIINENIVNTCSPMPSIMKQDCPVDCKLDDLWTYQECDKNTGKRKKSKRVLVNSMKGGLSCPSDLVEKDGYYVYEEEEDCPVDCLIGKTSQWSDCDKNTGLQKTLF